MAPTSPPRIPALQSLDLRILYGRPQSREFQTRVVSPHTQSRTSKCPCAPRPGASRSAHFLIPWSARRQHFLVSAEATLPDHFLGWRKPHFPNAHVQVQAQAKRWLKKKNGHPRTRDTCMSQYRAHLVFILFLPAPSKQKKARRLSKKMHGGGLSKNNARGPSKRKL
jgi:hypothetical protein